MEPNTTVWFLIFLAILFTKMFTKTCRIWKKKGNKRKGTKEMTIIKKLETLIRNAGPRPWRITEQGDLDRGGFESSMDIGDAELIATLVNCADEIVAVLVAHEAMSPDVTIAIDRLCEALADALPPEEK